VSHPENWLVMRFQARAIRGESRDLAVDAINTVGVSAGRIAFFAPFHVVNSAVSAVQVLLRTWFDSRQLQQV